MFFTYKMENLVIEFTSMKGKLYLTPYGKYLLVYTYIKSYTGSMLLASAYK